VVILNRNLRRSLIRKRGKIGLNQPLIYKHTFLLHSQPDFLYLPSSSQLRKKILGRNNIGGAFAPLPPPQVTPMTTIFNVTSYKASDFIEING
jgi:hypothetical protein